MDQDKVGITFSLLNKIYKKCDKIIIMKNSPLAQKILRMEKEMCNFGNPIQKKVCKYLKSRFFYNSQKAKLIEEGTGNVPEEIKEKWPKEDLYLYETWIEAPDGILITTDEKLIEAIKEMELQLHVIHLNEMLNNY